MISLQVRPSRAQNPITYEDESERPPWATAAARYSPFARSLMSSSKPDSSSCARSSLDILTVSCVLYSIKLSVCEGERRVEKC